MEEGRLQAVRSGSKKGGEEMSGLTVGPRAFMMQADMMTWSQDQIKFGGDEWHILTHAFDDRIIPTSALVYTMNKLDLRAFEKQGLDFLSINLQESSYYLNGAGDKATVVYDVLTTVKPDLHTLVSATFNDRVWGFKSSHAIHDYDEPTFNSTQVVWGQWRLFGQDSAQAGMLRVAQGSKFGCGEVAVAPALWWTRVVSIYDDAEGTVKVPSANLSFNATVIDLTEGEEVTQMMRGSQR